MSWASYRIEHRDSNGFFVLDYLSPKDLEASMGDDEGYRRFFYSLYRCQPDEANDFNRRRFLIAEKYPALVIDVGDYFILTGQAACEILSTHYYSLSIIEDYDQKIKDYYFGRYEEVLSFHQRTQSLPIPINLTEGQLGTDSNIGALIHEAVLHGMLRVSKSD